MNIAFVNSTKIWSGVKTWMLEFGNELRALGDGVSYVVSDPRFAGELARHGHDVLRLRFGPDYSPATVWRCYRYLRARRVDVACMNIQKELRTAGIAARLAGIPVIQRVGNPGDLTNKWDQRLTRRWIVDRMLVTSRLMREDILRRHSFIAPDSIVYIHNGKRSRTAPKVSKNRPVRFVVTSRIARGKGFAELVAACGRLVEDGVGEFTVDIFGEGPEQPAVERLIEAHGLVGRVRLRGFSRELDALLPTYDFGVLISDYESLSNTVLEYLAAGLPTIATRVGGIPEMLVHESNGFLLDPGDVDALVRHLHSALAMEDEVYARFSENAVNTIREQFNPSNQAQALQELAMSLQPA